MARLQLHATGDTPRTHDVSEGASIGRIEGNDIVIDHPSVSRRHATVQLRGEDWWVVDLGSTNGLKINGRATKEARIVPGDTIAIGSVPFKVEEAPQVKVQPGPHVEFNDSMFEESGTVMRKISDFNLEFGLDPSVAAAPQTATAPGTERAIVTREKIFSVLVQVAKVLLESEELNSVLNSVMDIIFKYLPADRGLLLLFDSEGKAVPKLTRMRTESTREDIPISTNILKMVTEQQVALLTSNALEDARLMGGQSIAMHSIRSAMCVPLWNRGRVIGAVQVDSPLYVGVFTEEDLDLLTALANFAAVAIERAQMAEKIEEEKKIRDKLERYHSPGVVDAIVQGAVAETGVRNAEVSILFADISGFTTISETKRPDEVAAFLDNFFSCAVDAIFTYGGTLDKFIGDAVMAFFGAPIAQDDHAARAVRAGLKMQRLVLEWNARRHDEGLPPVNIRIGINSGPAVVGNVGTEKRVDYTVLGTSVNIASRLESGVARPGQLVISQQTLDLVGGEFLAEPLGEYALKGLQQRMPVYSVAARDDTTSPVAGEVGEATAR